MCHKHVKQDDVIVDGKTTEEVDRCVYLLQLMTNYLAQVQEIKKRIGQR